MNRTLKNLIVPFLTVALAPVLAQAQVRDAASKALGDYAHGERSQQTYFAPVPVVRQPMATAQQGQSGERAARAFSYDARGQAAQGAPAPRTAKQPAPAPSVRRFSYEPGYAAPQRIYVPSRAWQSAPRDAGSKIRGDY
jgi:hypothetical protein